MFKKFGALLITLGLLLPHLVQPTFAESKITISSATSQELVDFLSEYNLTGCFTKSPEKTNLRITALEMACISMRSIGNRKMTSFTAFRKLLNEGFYGNQVKKNDNLNTVEMMRTGMLSYGITIPAFIPDSQWKYTDIDTDTTVHKAVEIGVFKTQTETRTGIRLNKKVSRSEALGFLFKLSLIEAADDSLFSIPQEENQSFFLNISNGSKLDVLEATINNIYNKSYYRNDFSETDAIHNAIKTVVDSLDDPYSEFYTPAENLQFFQGLKGDVEGIGAYIEKKDENILIISPIKGSPAEKAGLRAGDIVTHVNGESLDGLTLQEAVSKIKGPSGTSVNLTIKRSRESLEIQVTRGRVNIPSLTFEEQNGYYIISLLQFNLNAATELRPILEKAARERPAGVIIDVRNNPGGFLHVVIEMLDYFLNKGDSTVQIQTLTDTTVSEAMTDPIISDIPLAVIINKGSASASEILAGTLQDYDKAIIVGETSFGKGSVQEVISYTDGSALKITTAHWLTGKGNSINKTGIIPDIVITDNPGSPADEALEATINKLKNGSRSSLRR
ncbi:MAG: S41 family peptidase [Candidatus Gracilibacteria bacterium]|nr:S41 family peptidase [Candidatus Gracilibacteria bacterium]